MSTNNQQQSVALAQADQSAQQNFEQQSIDSPVAPCPATQDEIFILPSRYALSEQIAEHECVQPGVTPQSHPIALRRLRPGYLYLWHGDGPLRRFGIAKDGLLEEQGLGDPKIELEQGNQAGLILNKQHSAWLMYAEIPLLEATCEELTNFAAERSKRMRLIPMPQIATSLETTHCPALDQAEVVVAEFMPEVRDQSLAQDYHQNGDKYRGGVETLGQQMMSDPNPVRVQAYVDASTWLHEREQAAHRHPDAADFPPGYWSSVEWDVPATDSWVAKAKSEAGALHGVFATLNDELGVLRDINHEQEYVEARHESWIADNNLRQNVGSFIRSLITEDGAEVANLLNYRYREHDIELTAAQSESILQSQSRLEELLKEETRINHERGREYGHREADALLTDVHAEVAAATAPVREMLPPELYSEVEQVVRAYRREKATNLSGDRASAEVARHVDLDRMNTWLDLEAPAHYQQVNDRHQVLYADRARFLPLHGAGTWFVDYSEPDHQRWLDELAAACLSAQCTRQQGVEQFTGYVRSDDAGSLRLVFYAWSPSLEAAVNSTNRLNELVAALNLDNLANTRDALSHTLDEAALRGLERLAGEVDGYWATTVSRLGAALLALRPESTQAGQWMSLMAVVRFGHDSRLMRVLENGVTVWRLAGEKADALSQWTRTTAQAIRNGNAASILQAPIVRNSGGLLPLAALLLNALNASNYASQSNLLEEEGDQRRAERLSAALFTAAALVAVVQNWMIIGKGANEVVLSRAIAPTLTLFGGIVGGLSLFAALNELDSLKVQIENAQDHIDPWLDIRRLAVTGQVAVYGAQGLLGLALTGMRLANQIDTATAVRRFRLSMGPLNLLLLGLGSLYIYAWSRQATPLQNYLAGCCWSRERASRQEKLAPQTQLAEFEQLLALLYQPRLGMQTISLRVPGWMGDTVKRNGITSLTIDLPGADPNGVLLELTLRGNPNPPALEFFGKENLGVPTDLGTTWLKDSRCTWIPATEGQGLRLTGDFNRPLTRASLRLRYHSPVALLAGMETLIGGPRGVAYALGPDGLFTDGTIVELRSGDPTPELDLATAVRLDGTQYLQPKD
ncbi:toxin VasX [Halopseudomonas pelagia]|uniref:toxin VasX n=1 Tax=Halopseudomonas pelagia TaxID=553151 RepID=UPI0003A0EBF4|nr:toxin VasX [Halopseudomonas pelagia]